MPKKFDKTVRLNKEGKAQVSGVTKDPENTTNEIRSLELTQTDGGVRKGLLIDTGNSQSSVEDVNPKDDLIAVAKNFHRSNFNISISSKRQFAI